MQSDRLRALAQQIRIQTQQHPGAQLALAARLAAEADEATAAAADRLRETSDGIRCLACAEEWKPMTQAERDQLADFLDLAAGSIERVEIRRMAGGAA